MRRRLVGKLAIVGRDFIAMVGAPSISAYMAKPLESYVAEIAPGQPFGFVDERGRVRIRGLGLDVAQGEPIRHAALRAVPAFVGVVLTLVGVGLAVSLGAPPHLSDPSAVTAPTFRLAGFGWFLVIVGDVLRAWALYVYFRPVNRGLSMLGAWWMLLHDAVLTVASAGPSQNRGAGADPGAPRLSGSRDRGPVNIEWRFVGGESATRRRP